MNAPAVVQQFFPEVAASWGALTEGEQAYWTAEAKKVQANYSGALKGARQGAADASDAALDEALLAAGEANYAVDAAKAAYVAAEHCDEKALADLVAASDSHQAEGEKHAGAAGAAAQQAYDIAGKFPGDSVIVDAAELSAAQANAAHVAVDNSEQVRTQVINDAQALYTSKCGKPSPVPEGPRGVPEGEGEEKSYAWLWGLGAAVAGVGTVIYFVTRKK